MDSIEIKSGPATVIASGIVISFAGNPVEITYGPAEHRLKLIFEFKDKTEHTKPEVEGKVIDSKTLRITLFNFNSPLGTGSREALDVGEFDEKTLYLHYRVYSLEKGDKTIHYTIYKGGKVPDAPAEKENEKK